MHRNLSLPARAECAISGFLCLDIFKVLADERALHHGLPRGSQFMAPQTVHNLQGVALISAVICATKDANWHPWACGTARVTELCVEEWFSLLRRQSSNSQLSTRAFWQAGARQALKHSKILNKLKPIVRPPEQPLSDEE